MSQLENIEDSLASTTLKAKLRVGLTPKAMEQNERRLQKVEW